MQDRSPNNRRSVDSLAAWADGHETLCDERHASLKGRLSRIESIMLAVFGTIVVGGGTILYEIFKIHMHLAP